jgi:predicted N-acetyltransferase YhbS
MSRLTDFVVDKYGLEYYWYWPAQARSALGEPQYYERFGFSCAPAHGTVRYPAPFRL